MVLYTGADERPNDVSDADLDCSGMSLTVAQNDGFCAQGVLF